MKIDELKRYGTWSVTTEGDVEGRTIRHLGVFTGNFDEIALYLAKDSYYGLKFASVPPSPQTFEPTRTKVKIELVGLELPYGGSAGALAQQKQDLLSKINELLATSHIKADVGFYSQVELEITNEEDRKATQLEIEWRAAIAKLSERDLVVLGLK